VKGSPDLRPGLFILAKPITGSCRYGGEPGKDKRVSDIERKPKCRLCGNEMCVTRFQSSVTEFGIDREYAYECLWCGDTDKVISHETRIPKKELAA
jgi:hypothetical protein